MTNIEYRMSNNDRTFHYIILNKPYGVLCQFSDSQGRPTLASLGDFPEDVYPVGRLDYDSEGLVLLTNDNELKHKILDPKFKTPKTYLAQVERIPDVIALEKLRKGVVIEGKKTLPAKVKLLEKEPNLSPRFVPIRFRKNIPTAWLEITIYEGRNRQVRKMTAAAGHPTLRLIRIKIGKIELDDLQCGKVRNIELKDLDNLY